MTFLAVPDGLHQSLGRASQVWCWVQTMAGMAWCAGGGWVKADSAAGTACTKVSGYERAPTCVLGGFFERWRRVLGKQSIKIHPPEQSDWARLTQLLKSKRGPCKGQKDEEWSWVKRSGPFPHYHSWSLARYSLAWGILPHRKVTWGNVARVLLFTS